ncbi:hypothetical protein [Paraglaciecola polaris]|uniref:Uncharacterized protein n=1 Tax=Paraglaciecola polaris LMG 21857 TaxID=1129793 RepID=K6ZUH9_9ALTE|nr:hypothetical protein [Paraglaciecola polaris]GAC33937.1 hypothetical protein GPLA_3044 [Paraglaciecola polaris LMG 21857]|tara:strand:- start:517 stop:708 length:192 start_codon:yes stop_codon:yes gene_type:complete
MISKVIDFAKEWIADNLILVLLMAAMFAGMQYLYYQQSQALGEAAQQVEVLKLKISLTMEQQK